MKPFSLAVITVLLSAAPAIRAQVLTVDDFGPADFSSIRAAIDASPEGATILVRDGTYNEAGVFELIDKELVITADLGASVRIVNATLAVSDLAPGKTVILRGLTFAPAPLTEGVTVTQCQGTVWLEDSTFDSAGTQIVSGPAALVVEDSLLVLSRTSVTGLTATFAGTPAAGLHASGSTLHLFEAHVKGGQGLQNAQTPGPGGIGLSMDGGFLFAASSTIEGGQGGTLGSLFGCNGSGGMGGKGLVLDGGADAHLLGGALLPGAGGVVVGNPVGGRCSVGQPGVPSEIVAGALEAVAWPSHGLAVASPVRESEGSTASFTGVPGEFAWYLYAEDSQALFLPQVLGTLVLDFPLFIVPVGPLDAQGEAQAALAPALAPGTEALHFLLQSLFLDGASNSFTLSSPAALVVLADGF